MTEPTWITDALVETAARDADLAEGARHLDAERAERARHRLTRTLEQNGVPALRATFSTSPGGYLVAEVDGYRFATEAEESRYGGSVLRRLVTCAACQVQMFSLRGASGIPGDLGALLADPEPAYHHCPGRPVDPDDYDENGELIDRTPRPAPPPTPGERLLDAFDAYVDARVAQVAN